VEWVGVGMAVAKMLLRAADKENIADALDDASGGWAALRRVHRRDRSALEAVIANELEKDLGGASNAVEDDLRAAAQAVADLFNRLADDDDAVIVARIDPDQFLEYARKHGGNQERRLITLGAESTFDRILEMASAEFTRLAPGSSRFSDAALADIRRKLRTVADGIDELRSAPYAKAWAVMNGLARRLREGVRSDLGAGAVRLELNRADERARLVEAMTKAGDAGSALVVTGEPDVGKSALTLRAAEDLSSVGVAVTSLSLRDLPASILEMDQVLGMSISNVLGMREVRPLQLLVVDGAEAVLEGRREAFREVAVAAIKAGIGIVAVTRIDGLSRLREVLQAALSLAGKMETPAEHVVARLALAERQTLVERFGSLIRLTADPHAEWLVGRPGLVDVLLRAGTVSESTELLSEADVFAAVWNGLIRNGEEMVPGSASPDDREQAVLVVAARALGISVGVVPGGGVWASLRSDGVLRTPANPALASGDEFATDLIRDFALCRLFLRSGWEPLRAAGSPRWTIRAVRLACQAKLVVDDRVAAWEELHQNSIISAKLRVSGGARFQSRRC
jgi:NACHT N-terminal Helical domain 1